MRRFLLLGVLLLAGCQSLKGPRARRDDPEKVDEPRYNVGEQFRRSRDNLAFPDQSGSLAPRTYAEIPNATGR
jgi:hypothetical protein